MTQKPVTYKTISVGINSFGCYLQIELKMHNCDVISEGSGLEVWDARNLSFETVGGRGLLKCGWMRPQSVRNRAAMLEFEHYVARAGPRKGAEGRASASHCNAEQWSN